MADRVTGDNLRERLIDALDAALNGFTYSAGTAIDLIVPAIWPLVSAAVSEAEKNTARYRNALQWIGHIASVHYIGRAYDPIHMRSLQWLAADALAGKDLADYESAMNEAKIEGAKLAAAMANWFGDDEQLGRSVAAVDPEKEKQQ